ncbi:unnamed protein product [Lymnaea stagnalis]|uniref:TIR domain-containing protein n=1 Tax=Lymnaea stagnalis TaxID=6523 RepID=A0AAV2I727_LYMST
MPPITPSSMILAFVCLVITMQCAAPRNPASWADGTSTSPDGHKQRLRRDELTKANTRNIRVSENFRKFRTNFADSQKTTNVFNSDLRYDDISEQFHPENAFKCQPCVCKNISLNFVHVFCDDVMFAGHVPQTWPVEIDAIITGVTCSGIDVLDSRSLLMYSSLRYVKISTNSLASVLRSDIVNVSSAIIELDLSWNLISTVEENSFVLFPNLQELSLSHNKILNLTRQMFTGLYNLRSLSVSYNIINFIANDTFDDLGTLVTLDISRNRIIYKGHDLLPVGIFSPLKNLEQIYIDDICQIGTYKCGAYPNKALQVLTNLNLLKIDGADGRGLGKEIKSLIHLRHLIITFPEADNSTDESYFDNVPFVTTLHLSTISPYIEPKAYTKLKNLVNLTYSPTLFSYANLCQVLSDVQYLLNSSLTHLTLRHINHRWCGCKELRARDAEYLTMLKLVELDLSQNYLAYLSPDFLAMLPASLKKIDLSGNGLSYTIFYSFDKFPIELVELNLNNQYNVYYPCHDDDGIISCDTAKFLNRDRNARSSNLTLISTFKESGKSFKLQNLKHKMKNCNTETIEVSKDYLPPKLQILRGDNFRMFGKTMWDFYDVIANYSLRELSLAGGDFKTWASLSLMPGLEIADFSGNYADYFNILFFPQNSSLKYLSFSNNLLGAAFQYDTDSLFFANTKRLIALDMSSNFITELANDYLKSLAELQILDISKNKLQMINISFAHMTEIRVLDFSTNSITSISKQSRDDLDSIATDHRVYLDLTSNPLPCTCEGLELMKWMTLTNVFLLNQDFLVCRNEYDQVLEIGDLAQRVETLQRQCASKTVIILTCVFSFIIFGILLLASLMYRYRWKLRYLRSIALVKLVGSRPGAVKIGYKFDAYIIYSDDTRRFVVRDCVRELEEKRGHRLCIEERDFLPGTYNVSNIVSGVQNSARTVAMVTPEFYQGEYSEYGVKMALMEEIFMHRSVLFLCMCEPTDNRDLSHDLLTALKQNNYIEFPPRDDASDEMMDDFWNQFSRAIGRSIREEM